MASNTVTLYNGRKMPLVGLGTYKVTGPAVVHNTLEAAFSAGYRAFDTAAVYKNEKDLGNSLKTLLPKFHLERADVFITSKLGPKDQGATKCQQACLRSLDCLQVPYLDLYLVHWPGTQGLKPDNPQNVQLRRDSWRQMELLHKDGKLKSIGVSNYTIRHMEELLGYCEIKPAVLQVEYHPHLIQRQLVEFCKHHNIHFQAYSSLGSSSVENQLLNETALQRLATKHNKSSAQILLRWAVQQNIGVIPKSTNSKHIQENINIFKFNLPDEDMELINGLDKNFRYCWNPENNL